MDSNICPASCWNGDSSYEEIFVEQQGEECNTACHTAAERQEAGTLRIKYQCQCLFISLPELILKGWIIRKSDNPTFQTVDKAQGSRLGFFVKRAIKLPFFRIL